MSEIVMGIRVIGPVTVIPPKPEDLQAYLKKAENEGGPAGRWLARHYSSYLGPKLPPEVVKRLQQMERAFRRERSARERSGRR